jgi:hypothetical protein
MRKKKTKLAARKSAKKGGLKKHGLVLGEFRMSNLRLIQPNNLPSSVSDREIRKVVRSLNAAGFRK